MTTLMYFKLHLDFTKLWKTPSPCSDGAIATRGGNLAKCVRWTHLGRWNLKIGVLLLKMKALALEKYDFRWMSGWKRHAPERLGWLGWRSGWRFGKECEFLKVWKHKRFCQMLSVYVDLHVSVFFLMALLSNSRWLFTLIWQMMS